MWVKALLQDDFFWDSIVQIYIWLSTLRTSWKHANYNSGTGNYPLKDVTLDPLHFKYFWEASVQCWLVETFPSVFWALRDLNEGYFWTFQQFCGNFHLFQITNWSEPDSHQRPGSTGLSFGTSIKLLVSSCSQPRIRESNPG